MSLQDLYNKRAAAWALAQQYNERTDLTAEDKASWDRAMADIDSLTKDIERAERHSGLDKAFRKIDEQTSVVDPANGERGKPGQGVDEYRDAFNAYLRRGLMGITAEQRQLMEAQFRDLSAGTTTAGGFTVPQGFWARVVETLKWYAVVYEDAEFITTETGNLLPWPTNDDTANIGEIIGENTTITFQDVTFAQTSLSAFIYSTKGIKASLALLQDSGIDMESWLAKKMGQRFGRILNTHLTTGTGTGQPQGFITGATTGKTGLVGQTTTVIYDDLVDLQHSVDVAYRNANAKWYMHDLSLAVVRKLNDTQGHPLWEPSLTTGVPSTLLGAPVRINNFMATMAANAKSIAYGDLNTGYVVRQAAGLQMKRLDERFAELLQVAFFGFGRFDGKVQDSSAFKLYVNSAT